MMVGRPLVVGIVGADGCGKSSTYRGLLHRLARQMPVHGVGEELLRGGPGLALAPPPSTRLSRTTARVGALARGTRADRPYQLLKLLELSGRSRSRDAAVQEARAAVVVTDGDPLVNSAAWSAAGYYVSELAGQDDRLLELVDHLAGAARLSLADLRRLPRRAWQLALAERLGLVRFAIPDLVVLLAIDGATGLARIKARGRPLQAHEGEAFLDRLAGGYERVCDLLARHRGIEIVRIDVARTPLPDVLDIAEEAVLGALASLQEPVSPDVIDVIATTISGSLADQRNVGRIGPGFQARTSRPVRVHRAATHPAARQLAHDVVTRGGRTIVSAGGAGTFNAVLEGCHLDDGVPADLRLAFLRKGSADLIGKALHVPGDLEGAVAAITTALERDATVDADILVVEAATPDGSLQRRHMVGFAGLGLFGDVPRFTESRLVKLYKGVLGSLFGDYGPFFVGLTLASGWWFVKRRLGQVPPMALSFDDEEEAAASWLAVIVVNGDLGHDFPLGRGLAFGSGTFRVVALRYRDLGCAIAQLQACRSGAILDKPSVHGAIVREVRSLSARPSVGPGRLAGSGHEQMVNLDGLRMLVRGEARVAVAGRVRLVLCEARQK